MGSIIGQTALNSWFLGGNKMPYDAEQPTLTGVLSWIPLKHLVKKRVFGERYLRLWDFFTTLSFQYESGAILGRAKRNKISTLADLLVVPGLEISKSVKLMQDQAKDRLEKFRNELGKEPDTFHEFIFNREFNRVLVESIGMTLDELFLRSVKEQKDIVVKVSDHKMSLDIATHHARIFGLEGIGFGSVFPELTESMYKNAYENVDKDSWSFWRAHGLDIPKEPDIVTLKEREDGVLATLAGYTYEFYPELLDPLNLRVYLEEK
jgi:hypothetical protein